MIMTAWRPRTVRAPTLIIGYGNPSRGDDALGPVALEEIERRMARFPAREQIDYVTDFQLQVEFVTDLSGRQRIIFIDAAATGMEPFTFGKLEADREGSITSHALSPASLLTVYKNTYGEDAPACFLLGIRGNEFELGTPLSERAKRNLDAALAMLDQWLVVNCTASLCHA
jgi:hydrogenase maturation protease